MVYLLLLGNEASGDHGAWWWAIGSTFVAVCNGLGLLYALYKRNKRTDSEKVVGQYEKLLEEHKTLLKEKENRDRKRDKRVEELEAQLDAAREEHRADNRRSWEEHRKCLERENKVRMRLDSHERALREAHISFEEFEEEQTAEGS